MQAFLQYLRERFPIGSVLLYGLGYAGLVVGTQHSPSVWLADPIASARLLLTVIGIFTMFLFRQRAVDEFRDFNHDAKYFPDRPLHRGLVTKRQVIAMGVYALIIELLLVASIAPLFLYLPVFLFTVLMAKDYFIKSWLDQHFTTHFFLHELFFIIFGWFFVTALRSQSSLGYVAISILVLVVAPMSIELVRKFKPRYDPQGKPVSDSYTVVWGHTRTVLFLMLLTLITGIGLTILKIQIVPLFLASLLALLIWFNKKNDKVVMMLGIIQYLALALSANLIW